MKPMKNEKPQRQINKKSGSDTSPPVQNSKKRGLLKRFLAWIARGSKNNTCPI
jgi:hypothetical protein